MRSSEVTGTQEVRLPGGRRLRVLLLAEACNPEWTSVPLEGFSLFNSLRTLADVTLVTQVRNREALYRSVQDSTRIKFIDSERVAAPLNKLGAILTLHRALGWTTRQAVMLLGYLYFEHLVYREFRAALHDGEYDLVHRITPLSPTYPSPIACRIDIPFVLGPLNGGLPWPKGTWKSRVYEMEWLSWVRDAYRVMPYVRTTYQRAACVIAGSQYTLQTLPESARRRAVYIPENGVDPTVFYVGQRTPPSTITPFRIVFAGRLVPYKGADMLLEAVATSERLRSTSQIIIAGAGPQRGYLTKLANSVGIDDRVRIEGHMRQPQLRQLYCESSVFAFPSLREFGGAVVLEAMACGLPCVVLDYGGPGEHVTPETGVRLPLGSRGEIVAALRAALEMLHSQPDVLDIMSHNAIQRVANSYTWAVKARQICDQYHRVLQWPPVDPKHVPHGI